MVCIAAFLALAASACGAGTHTLEKSPANLFPDLDGWTRDGQPETYLPETLFDYIDGGADLYLSYDFQELATLNYDSGDKSITVDIYRHGSRNDGFGIYSQEKSLESTFIPVGTQGYYDRGVLNFFKGPYYVKIMAFGLGDDEMHVLMPLAQTIAGKLDVPADMPPELACFPEQGKIENSERYIARDFLGHGFLHSAFIAEYLVKRDKDEIPVQLFIIGAADEAGAREMIAKYRKHCSAGPPSGGEPSQPIRLEDPYYTSKGMINLMTRGRYIWGLFGDDPEIYMTYLRNMEQRLADEGLIDK